MEDEVDPFEFTLARALGMTRDELRERMSNHEYMAWSAFYKYESVMMDYALEKGKKRKRK